MSKKSPSVSDARVEWLSRPGEKRRGGQCWLTLISRLIHDLLDPHNGSHKVGNCGSLSGIIWCFFPLKTHVVMEAPLIQTPASPAPQRRASTSSPGCAQTHTSPSVYSQSEPLYRPFNTNTHPCYTVISLKHADVFHRGLLALTLVMCVINNAMHAPAASPVSWWRLVFWWNIYKVLSRLNLNAGCGVALRGGSCQYLSISFVFAFTIQAYPPSWGYEASRLNNVACEHAAARCQPCNSWNLRVKCHQAPRVSSAIQPILRC